MKFKYILLSVVCMHFSCKKFLTIDPPKSSLVNETVFNNDSQAISTVTGIYATMAGNSYASGSGSVSFYAGLSSDELIGYGTYLPIYQNQLYPELDFYSSIYSGPYKTIYTANAVLEGLSISNAVTPTTKTQLEGEALFLRAFAYFNLVNLFGEVPLHLSADYKITSTTAKSPVEQIYNQILADFNRAELLLPDAYPTNSRARPNKSAVQAMLARTYLYMRNWENAEKYASLVISKSATYMLVDLDAVFLANNKEAIWQLMPAPNQNTQDGNLFLPGSLTAAPSIVSLSSDFALNAYESNDKRKASWIRSFTTGAGTFYYPFKYKLKATIAPVTEFSTVLRLAEQYLIRAEAKMNQDNIKGGIADLNLVRQRPQPNGSNSNPISPLSIALSKADGLLAVERERKIELFSEWGHRWFDLKRTGKADAILRPIKPLWQSTDLLYPIPYNEILRNPKIRQNDGY